MIGKNSISIFEHVEFDTKEEAVGWVADRKYPHRCCISAPQPDREKQKWTVSIYAPIEKEPHDKE